MEGRRPACPGAKMTAETAIFHISYSSLGDRGIHRCGKDIAYFPF